MGWPDLAKSRIDSQAWHINRYDEVGNFTQYSN